MPEVLRFELAGTRLRVQRWNTDGTLLAQCDIRSDRSKQTDREFKVGADALNASGNVRVTKEELWCHVTRFLDGNTDPVILYPGGKPPEDPFRVRKRTSPEVLKYSTIHLALGSPHGCDDMVEWDSKEACCALDLDFHGVLSPGPEVLALSARRLRPIPFHWWITRSQGLRCIYTAGSTQNAETLAAIAAFELIQEFPDAGLELLTRTRFPPGEVHSVTFQDEGADAIRRLQGQYTIEDHEYQTYLEERGWVVGERYPHDTCPGNPSPRAKGNAAPVCVHEDHVFCYVCAADGLCYGAHTPGYFPAARLCGGYSRSLFALCVKALTHWEHARHVVSTILPGRPVLARAIYHAALLRTHGAADGRIPRVFTAGENLIRYDGHWGDDQGRPVTFREDRPQRILELPTVLVADGESGDLLPSFKTAEWLRHTGDISRYGYPAVVPIWGIHLSYRIEPEGWKVCTVLNTPALKAESLRDRRPRYLRSHMPEGDAWGILEELFPRVDRKAVELLIVAKGCAEIGSGLPPMIFLTGPTGAGKSATVKLVAAILGDHATEVPYASSTERLRAGLISAKKKGTFAVFDEFLKGAGRERKDPAQAMEALLNFTPDSESHVIYVGPVALGSLPVCAWCDTSIPREVAEHAQLARRLAWVKLPARMRWEESLGTHGIPGPDALRTHGSRRILDAADTILSVISDKYFKTVPIFRDVVHALGFKMLEDIDVTKEKEDAIRLFYRLVCDAPKLAGSHAERWPGPGWKVIDRCAEGTRFTDLWKTLADTSGIASRTLEESDLAAVCGLRVPADIEIRNHGSNVYIRFKSGTQVNEELYEVELPTERPSVHGSGDAICSEHPPGWGTSIPAALQYEDSLWCVPAGQAADHLDPA